MTNFGKSAYRTYSDERRTANAIDRLRHLLADAERKARAAKYLTTRERAKGRVAAFRRSLKLLGAA